MKTGELELAAYLLCLKCNLTHIEIAGDRKGIFHFADVDPVLIDQYDNGQAKVEPNTFHVYIRLLTTSTRRQASLMKTR